MGYGGLPRPKVYDHKSYFSIQNFVGILGLYMCWKNNILTISNNLTHIDSAYTILIQSNSFKKCNASDLVFLILKKNSYSVIHESFIIFFWNVQVALGVWGPTQSELILTRREDLKNDQFWGAVPAYKSSRYVSATFLIFHYLYSKLF